MFRNEIDKQGAKNISEMLRTNSTLWVLTRLDQSALSIFQMHLVVNDTVRSLDFQCNGVVRDKHSGPFQWISLNRGLETLKQYT